MFFSVDLIDKNIENWSETSDLIIHFFRVFNVLKKSPIKSIATTWDNIFIISFATSIVRISPSLLQTDRTLPNF